MKQLEFLINANIENENTADVYNNLGVVSESKEDQNFYYNEAIRIYNNCNIDNDI